MSSLFVGPIFEILAGPNHTKFIAHPDILEKSETLRAIVQGKWKDSTELKVVLEDWDPEIVGRLLEWLYTSDYESPYPTEVPQSGAKVLEISAPKTSVPSDPKTKTKFQSTPKSENAGRSLRALTPFAELHFHQGVINPSDAEAFQERAAEREIPGRWQREEASERLQGEAYDFEAALLAHAKLYALADYMLLPALQAHVFERLKALLIHIKEPTQTDHTGLTTLSSPLKDTQIIGNIITLVQYVYLNTTKLQSEEEPLRELISTFIASNFVSSADHEEDNGKVFKEVFRCMDQSEDIMEDVNDKVRRRGSRQEGSAWGKVFRDLRKNSSGNPVVNVGK